MRMLSCEIRRPPRRRRFTIHDSRFTIRRFVACSRTLSVTWSSSRGAGSVAERRRGGGVRVLPVVLATLTTLMSGAVAAQDRPGPAVEATAGWVGFADDGIVS